MIDLKLNPLAVIALLIAICGYITAAVFAIYGRSRTHRIWAFFNFSVANWSFFLFLGAATTNPFWSYKFWVISHVTVIYVAISYAHFVHEFCNYKFPALIWTGYIYGIVQNILLIFTDGKCIYEGTKYLYNSFFFIQMRTFPWLSVFLLWMILMGWAHIRLYQYHKLTSSPKSKEAVFILIIMVLGFTGGISTVYPMAGYHNFYPYTLILTLFYEIGASYTIFRRQILELDFVIQKGVLYSILVSSLTLLYLLLIFIADQFLQHAFNAFNFTTRIVALIIIGLAFNPLRNRIQAIIDHTLFKGTPIQLAEQNQLLRENAVHSEKMRTIATLASGVAHEIRNPLTALKTFVEYFPKKKNDPAFIAKFESIAGTEINRIESILNELLAFAKPSPLSLTDTDIKKTLEHALNLTANQLGKNKVEVKTDFVNDLPLIKADTNKLLQVFINLILNANDAMPNGGVLAVVTSVQPPASSVQISLTDTGCGIEPKDLVKIFEPFFSTKEKGTGLGLAIVKGIIEDHGGKIMVKSIKNQGTTFTITLPTTSSRREATP